MAFNYISQTLELKYHQFHIFHALI